MPDFIFTMKGLGKTYPPDFKVFEDIYLSFYYGAKIGVLGSNGAGKSTLLKILSGAHAPDSGTIEFDGRSAAFASPHEAQAAGVVTIYQEFTLAPDMTVAENVFIGREPGSRFFISNRRLEAKTRELASASGSIAAPPRACATSRLPSSRWSRSPARSR